MIQEKAISQIVGRYAGLMVNQLSTIPIGEARLLLYPDLQDVLHMQPGSKTLTFLAMALCTGCQSLADVISVGYIAFMLKISPHTVSSPIIGRWSH